MGAYPEDPHPARELPPARRMDYLHAVAAMVHADGQIDDLEVEILRRLGVVMELDDSQVDEIVKSVREPDRARVDAILTSFAKEDLRVPLLADAILVAFADGRVAAAESKEIAEYANALHIDAAQAVLIARYVEEVLIQNRGGELSQALSVGLADAASQLHPPRGVKWLYRKLTEK